MPGFIVTIEGLEEVQAMFDALPLKYQAKCLRPAMRDGAKVLLDAVREESPVFSGAMRDAFHIKSSSKKNSITMQVIAGTKEDLGIPETTKSGTPRGYYPGAIEYGWRPSNRPLARVRRRRLVGKDSYAIIRQGVHDAEFGTRRVPANPFMHRAFETSQAEATAKIAESLSANVTELVGSATAAAEQIESAAA